MVIVMNVGATAAEISAVIARVTETGFRAHLVEGEERTIIGV
ncbi:MAG: 3-deoxy-7-phosphoheptulonate synthase, partial [Anaerolineae bacterium]|nr:3-deoxy-7-phosphoheptulonate synthase [Anaerolineae bacterium]